MERRIVKRHNNSRYCFVCGIDNEYGLRTEFYELDTGELLGICKPGLKHQSYPDRTHGGVTAALLDEVVGRAINVVEPEVWGVTIGLSLTYRKPVPYDVEVKALARLTRNTHNGFEAEGELILPNGIVAVQAKGKYYKVKIEDLTTGHFVDDEWFLVPGGKTGIIEI